MAIKALVAALATAAVSSRLDLALIIVAVAVVVVVMLVLVMINVVIDKIVCADDDRRTKRFIGIIRAFPWPRLRRRI